ncbi:ATP-binding protein [Dyella japonica]|uniref:histidine kinase n=1 Tax=Dyella japonica TaxID=231455 RepID=A0ABV2K1D4_9GAMM
MDKFNIRSRLLSHVAVFCVAIAAGGIGYYSMATGNDRLRGIYEDHVVAMVHLGDVLDSAQQIQSLLNEKVLGDSSTDAAASLEELDGLRAERITSWERYLGSHLPQDESQRIQKAERDISTLDDALQRMIHEYRHNGHVAGLALAKMLPLNGLLDATREDTTDLLHLHVRLASDEYASAQHSYAKSRVVAFGTIGLGWLITLIVVLDFLRSFIVPLHRAIDVTENMAGGNVDAAISITGASEVARLLRALARMQHNLRDMSSEVRMQLNRLQDMSNSLPLAVFQMRVFPDGSREYLFVARSVKNILGVPSTDLMKDPTLRFRYEHCEDTAMARSTLATLIARVRSGEKEAAAQVTTRVSFDGKTHIVLSVAHGTHTTPDGAVIINGYYQDITDQRQAHKLLQDVLDGYPSVVSVKDTEGRYLLTNRACDRTFSRRGHALVGKTDFDHLPLHIAENLRQMDKHVLSVPEAQHVEYEVPVLGGEVLPFEVAKFRLVDEAGKPYGVCTIASDISERRAAERALRDSEAYQKVLFESSHVPMIVIDPISREFIDCNPAAIDIFGYGSKSEVLGKTAIDVSAPFQSDGTESLTALTARRRSTPHQQAFLSYEWRHQRPDGEIWDAVVRVTNMRHHGKTLLLATLEDVTVQRQAEQAIRIAKEAAEDIARAKSDFLAIMTHEIRTPLTTILGHLELLGRSRLSGQEGDRLRIIDASSRTLLELIDSVLDFSKVESGQLRLEAASFDIVELVEHLMAMFAPSARKKGLSLVYAIPPTLSRCYVGDSVRIRQILVNLLGNAIKFTEAGSVTMELHQVTLRTNTSLLEFHVHDTGIGISTTVQNRLFQPFRQADTSITRRFGGTGLGLALCKRLTALMGGTISLNSTPGMGSTFTISLPLPATDDQKVSSQRYADLPRIAFATNEPAWQASIVPHLQAWGVSVLAVQSMQELSDSSTPLLVFDGGRPWSAGEETAIMARTAWIIRATEDGSQHPNVDGKRIGVSCYTIDALQTAVDIALLGRPLKEPSPAPTSNRESGRSSRPARLLVVEDHTFIQTLYAEQFQILGCAVEFAENGEVALRKIDNESYDLIFTDLSMPVIDGYELARRLRTQGVRVPIVAVTAHTVAKEDIASAGIDDVLIKPFSLDEMDAMIRRHSGRCTNHASEDNRL